MDYLSNLAKGSSGDDKPKPTSDNNPAEGHKPSNSELLSKAKVVAEAAQAQFRGEKDKFDKAKVAGASADLLDAAEKYGKLDEKQGMGKYVEQAEDYLRKTSHTTTTTTPAPTEAEKPADAASGGGGGGAEGLMKMAGGFLKK